jgi:glyoxylase-like metal-dependent hydrolase (beta-lactamase superfamily II)
MFLRSMPCGPLQANCYLVAAQEASECVIIDPGQESFRIVTSLRTQHRLTPVAIFATHGHLDHIGDAARLADHFQIPAWIHPLDRHLFTNPGAGLGPEWRDWSSGMSGVDFVEPRSVEEFGARDQVEVAGLTFEVTHAPGHTSGSVLLTVAEPSPVVFSGDVVFAGSVGRTDLPGSDHAAMIETLKNRVLSIVDAARIYPGHGPSTTMAHERATNPYLSSRFLGL